MEDNFEIVELTEAETQEVAGGSTCQSSCGGGGISIAVDVDVSVSLGSGCCN